MENIKLAEDKLDKKIKFEKFFFHRCTAAVANCGFSSNIYAPKSLDYINSLYKEWRAQNVCDVTGSFTRNCLKKLTQIPMTIFEHLSGKNTDFKNHQFLDNPNDHCSFFFKKKRPNICTDFF